MPTPGWCSVCCTRHVPGTRCPGELLATGPERPGWRVSVFTASGIEHYGVLVAPAGDVWRSRILTYPNMLWSAPGTRGTMKFVGATATEAERAARAYVEEVCKAREYRVIETTDLPQRPRVEKEAAAGADSRSPEERLTHSVAVRFGTDAATRRATTQDLSNGGLFIVTKQSFARGTRLAIVLELEEAKLPLVGVVAWVRTEPEGGRPAGMGVQLQAPPALYQHYVNKLSRE